MGHIWVLGKKKIPGDGAPPCMNVNENEPPPVFLGTKKPLTSRVYQNGISLSRSWYPWKSCTQDVVDVPLVGG